MTKHTKEPWEVGATGDGRCRIWAENQFLIAHTNVSEYLRDETWKANARRIVACVNACADMQTEFLESFKVIVAVGSAVKHGRQRDELLSICKSILAYGIGASDLERMRVAIAEIEATK